jgi:hypothetical protein
MLVTGAKANDGRYVLFFEGKHEACTHTKHIAKVLDYTFVFCKETKAPIAIYCGSEIVEDADVKTLVAELAEKYSFTGSSPLVPLQSPFFDELAKALLSVEKVEITN